MPTDPLASNFSRLYAMSNLITRFDEAIGKAVSDLPAENPAKRFELLQSIRSRAASFRAVPESIQTELLVATIYFVQTDAKTLENLDSLLRMALHQVDLYAAETPKSEPFHSASEAEPKARAEQSSAHKQGYDVGTVLGYAAFAFSAVVWSPIAIPALASFYFMTRGKYGDPTPVRFD